ncbi:replication restart DNA helicase PriA [Granulicatella balaenopterae]|uniref:Replication restart protein PriA n=1 Tax=Granulicatella balaenopterae TaxID=137733 RepID=A0A1H9KT71_9LACT|nr:primosomal protein N' [Granulicatella balaenopterae]SER02117.1 replication restart DNA helicase PriA [Granulicatella balaenopterae]
MYAKVIVDVWANQLNRPFDYLIPEEFEDIIEVGMRVAVPFGSRTVQGFVMDIVLETTFEGKISPIIKPMDLEPVLTPEMILLGQHMSQTVFAFLISCYQTMLPPMLKSKYEKYFHLKDPEAYPEIYQNYFNGEDTVEDVGQFTNQELAKLLRLRKEGVVSVEHKVIDKAKVKMEDWLIRLQSPMDYQVIQAATPLKATKQKLFLAALEALPKEQSEILKKDFVDQNGFTAADVKTAISKGWVKLEKRPVNRDPYAGREFTQTNALQLNEAQQLVFDEVLHDMRQDIVKTYLLEGVTGSGKTELYLQWIDEVIQKGKSAMMLVPEISLTPQMVNRFKSRFGDRVAVLHSGLSAGEKFDEWRKIKNKEADIVVGARSSIFAPIEDIGIIILDEEHESSYKQEENPRYHARDIAIWRARYHHCPVILGSATPSLESRARAQKSVYQLLELPTRAKDQPLPEVKIIDMKQEYSKNRGTFSLELQEAIKDRLDKKEQTVLLLNRRGYSSFVMCRDCGYVLECPNCDISLTLHMDVHQMKCHYCGFETNIPRRCPKCFENQIRYYGTGTQKVEEELQELFPEARIIRMDVDTTRKKGQHEALLNKFGSNQADILLGTQMIAKGLDFPNVTLVGVINADTSLNIPDFRSFERTFQLLTQVAGRAGRGDLAGEVMIQSFNPENYAIQLAKSHNYREFYAREMQVRHMGNYPPYVFTTMITVSSEEEGLALREAVKIRQYLEQILTGQTILLGPTPKSIARINKRYYFQILIKYKREPQLTRALNELMLQTQQTTANKVTVSIDVEPMSFL